MLFQRILSIILIILSIFLCQLTTDGTFLLFTIPISLILFFKRGVIK